MNPLLAEVSNPTLTVWTYLCYLAISIALTVWVARTLHKNGRIFLVDSFLGNEALADSVNHLLVVGFYLVNIGFVTLALKYGDKAADAQTARFEQVIGQHVGGNRGLRSQHHGPLHYVFELADIAGPVIVHEQIHRLRRHARNGRAVRVGAELLDEEIDQQRHVFAAFP